MHVICTQAALAAVVGVANRAIVTKPPMQVLTNVLLAAEGGQLRATGDNGALLLESSADVEVLEPGTIVLPSDRFGQLVGRLSPDDPETIVEIVADEQGTVRIEAGGWRPELRGINAGDYPATQRADGAPTVVVEAGLLKRALKRVGIAVSKAGPPPVITGVHVGRRDGEDAVWVAATDQARLSGQAVPAATGGAVAITVPAKSAAAIERLLGADGEARLWVYDGGRRLQLAYGAHVCVSTLLTEGRFPQWRDHRWPEAKTLVRLQRSALDLALQRAAIFSEGGTDRVTLTVGDAGITIEPHSRDFGISTDSVPGVVSGEAMTLIVNARYITDFLASGDREQTEVHLHLAAPNQVVRLAFGDEPDAYRYLMMPLAAN